MNSEYSAEEMTDVYQVMAGKLPRFTPEPGQTAFVVVDLQYGCSHREWGAGKRAYDAGLGELVEPYFQRIDTTVVPNVRRLIATCREAGIEVIYSRVASMSIEGLDTSDRHKAFAMVFPPQSHEAQVLEEIAPLPGELVFSKTTASVFASTTVDLVLRRKGIRNLIFAGVLTNGCVQATVLSAGDIDYRIMVVEDACAAYFQPLHDAALFSIGLKDAVVKSTDEVLRLIQGTARPAAAGS